MCHHAVNILRGRAITILQIIPCFKCHGWRGSRYCYGALFQRDPKQVMQSTAADCVTIRTETISVGLHQCTNKISHVLFVAVFISQCFQISSDYRGLVDQCMVCLASLLMTNSFTVVAKVVLNTFIFLLQVCE